MGKYRSVLHVKHALTKKSVPSSAKQQLEVTIFDNLNIQLKIFYPTYLVHANHSTRSVLHKNCKMQARWNYANTVTIAQVLIFMVQFPCRCRHIAEALNQSMTTWYITIGVAKVTFLKTKVLTWNENHWDEMDRPQFWGRPLYEEYGFMVIVKNGTSLQFVLLKQMHEKSLYKREDESFLVVGHKNKISLMNYNNAVYLSKLFRKISFN